MESKEGDGMLRKIQRALVSVGDKTGLVELAQTLVLRGVELVSTGGTRQTLVNAGLAVRDISELTGFPEILGGRVKTLHPAVHGGILAVRDDPEHVEALLTHDLQLIDLVVCNLYPFEAIVAHSASTPADIIENIDIGGVTLLRAAAKNYRDVAILSSPDQYKSIIEELEKHDGSLTLTTREELAAAAFSRTASYDSAIAAYFLRDVSFPKSLTLTFQRKGEQLRYGENPHQPAAFYAEPSAKHACVATAEVLHGKELSYNNILDLDSALNLVREFAEPAAAVIKHNNPCGAAESATLTEAFAHAYEGDPLSAFGGILAFNRNVDEATAMAITEPNRFIECIIAPEFEPKAFEVLTTRPTWKKSVRLLRTGPLTNVGPAKSLDYRRIDGGLLVQARDRGADFFDKWKVVTKRQPTPEELDALWFAWRVCKHVKSNAIVLATGRQIVGVGAGQMSRVDSTGMAITKAGTRAKGAVLASDAFFPFRDNVDTAAAAGITAIVQPGGSVRDGESIAACDEHGIAMMTTEVRHFRH